MSDEIKNSPDESINNIIVDISHKRKRVKRIKVAIIITIIFLFLLPTILCLVLGIQLSKLQRQVDNLFSTYSSEFDDKERRNIISKYAFASTDELSNEIVSESDVAQIDTPKNNADDSSTDISDIGDDIDYSSDSDIVDDTDSIIDTDTIEDEADTVEDDIDMTEDDIDMTEDDADMTEDDIEVTEDETNLVDDELIIGPDTSDIPDEDNKDSTKYTVEYYRNPDGIYYDKRVYLTFDDGPSNNTDQILDTLAEYKVKATFFVVGHEDELSLERYKRIVNEGHIIAIHSFSHKYKEIYKSLENFDKDFTKLWNLLYDTTGYTPTLYRFPGGSLSLSKSKIKVYSGYLNEKGINYYDWNVVNGDAEGIDYTEEQMIHNVLNGVAQKKTSIVLMHDGYGKERTADILPKILDALISGGAEVLPMDDEAPLIQQIKASSLK